MRADVLVRHLLASVAAISSVAVASSLPLAPGLLHPRQQTCQIQAKRLARDESPAVEARSSASDTGLDTMPNQLEARQHVMTGTCTTDRPNGECHITTYTLMPDGNWLVCNTDLPCDSAHQCTADGNHCSWSEASGNVVCE
ncbi:hypothetical protein V8F06_014734 [Rhypophila decipiens]